MYKMFVFLLLLLQFARSQQINCEEECRLAEQKCQEKCKQNLKNCTLQCGTIAKNCSQKCANNTEDALIAENGTGVEGTNLSIIIVNNVINVTIENVYVNIIDESIDLHIHCNVNPAGEITKCEAGQRSMDGCSLWLWVGLIVAALLLALAVLVCVLTSSCSSNRSKRVSTTTVVEERVVVPDKSTEQKTQQVGEEKLESADPESKTAGD